MTSRVGLGGPNPSLCPGGGRETEAVGTFPQQSEELVGQEGGEKSRQSKVGEREGLPVTPETFHHHPLPQQRLPLLKVPHPPSVWAKSLNT